MEEKLYYFFVNTSHRGVFSFLLFHYTRHSRNSGAVQMETMKKQQREDGKSERIEEFFLLNCEI